VELRGLFSSGGEVIHTRSFASAVRAALRGSTSTAAVIIGVLTLGAASAAAPSSRPTAAASAAQLPAPPANGEMGFVFSFFVPAVYPGMKDACPNGYSYQVRESFLSTLSPAERARLLKPENEVELTTRWKAYGVPGPARRNLCTNYDEFPDHPEYKTVQSKIAYGVNLDDDATGKPNDPYVCPHRNFVSPAGEKGIDNQMYRALGCERTWRGPDGKTGDILPGFSGYLATGEYTIVMILRNVHSLVNDDNVEVVLASSLDHPIVDTQQHFIRDASYQVASNPHWRTVLQGHLRDGVLTTDSRDVVLKRRGERVNRGLQPDWDFARAKLQLAFKPDGTLDGVMGGYVPLMMYLLEHVGGGAGTVTVADIDCAAAYVTLKKMADGARDPETGQCNRISVAIQVQAVPAFVFDQPAATKTAAAK
jgi:hypothetical protein